MQQNVSGILMVIAAMAAFTIEDVLIKQLTQVLPRGQVMILLGLGGGLVFFAMALARRDRIAARGAWSRLTLARAGTEIVAAMGFVTALSLVDISVVASVFQVTPLAITMGAALFFGEAVGWRRWTAIALGFSGVLLILRPGLGDFEPAALLTLLAVVGIAARDLLTRLLPADAASSVIGMQGFLAMSVAGVLMFLIEGAPMGVLPMIEALRLLAALLFGVLGYYGIVTAMRVADASAVTPFRYARLLFSLILGVIIFEERPDLLTLTGAALIIATGLYTFLRERRLAKRIAVQATV
ncbi:DMT family transporter [Rhodalgimonas zhirmunskyi]|uniref:DMT family transporter n=1 Tax=Rhodalgimonas zhirmunskyi TaxID=2964767 RepID=A0AAJ1U971_9RHOB|nr:DMT family transporter [Rhodoalgimonas zhirmunskyi]MDQ2095279.1 DMT family transporter [Rhodoalgimonas zhirmunskyi]